MIGPWRPIVASTLVASAALFVVGVAVERNSTHTESVSGRSLGGEAGHAGETHSENGERSETHTGPATNGSTTSGSGESEKVLGINLESNAIVAAMVAASVLLAGVVLALRTRGALVAAGLFAVTAMMFDIAEVSHQANLSKSGLAAIAAGVGLLHAVAVAAVIASQASSSRFDGSIRASRNDRARSF